MSQFSLSQLAAKIDADRDAAVAAGVHPDIADGDAFGRYEDAQERAAYVAEMEEERAAGIGPDADLVEIDGENHRTATFERVAAALNDGGRAALTVRSHRSGQHVKVVLVCRKRRGEHGWVSRNTIAGRVGFLDADCIEARDPEREFPENYIGRFYRDTGEWRPGRDADAARAWAAEKLIRFYLSGGGITFSNSDVFLATQCSVCAHKLDDPVSIERGIGPECFGRVTGSRHAGYEARS